MTPPLSPLARQEAMYREASDLLDGFPRDNRGNLRGARLRQLKIIVESMLHTFTDHDYSILKSEIVKLRQAHATRLEKWRRYSGGH